MKSQRVRGIPNNFPRQQAKLHPNGRSVSSNKKAIETATMRLDETYEQTKRVS